MKRKVKSENPSLATADGKAPAFQEFWDAYALKRDRMAAERAWRRLSAKDRLAAFAGIASYTADCERRGISRMYAQGYLNHRRWEDDFGQYSSAPQKTASCHPGSSFEQTTDTNVLDGMEIW